MTNKPAEWMVKAANELYELSPEGNWFNNADEGDVAAIIARHHREGCKTDLAVAQVVADAALGIADAHDELEQAVQELLAATM